MTPILYGPAFSSYVRTVRLTLEEKAAAYQLVELDAFAGAHKRPEHLARHPFGKVPALEHDGFIVFETQAIIRYIDRVFPGRRLQPDDPKRAARMDTVIGVVDAYGYPCMISRFVLPRFMARITGCATDETTIAEAQPDIRTALAAIARQQGGDDFLAGPEISLADLFVAPVFGYLTSMPEAGDLLAPHAGLRAWWGRMAERDSMAKTAPQLE